MSEGTLCEVLERWLKIDDTLFKLRAEQNRATEALNDAYQERAACEGRVAQLLGLSSGNNGTAYLKLHGKCYKAHFVYGGSYVSTRPVALEEVVFHEVDGPAADLLQPIVQYNGVGSHD